ncbi:MAG: hypothetical protein V3U52_08040 [Thermoplasmata archaeon]
MTSEECAHDKLEFMGEDESRNRYSRCSDCGSVIITDGAKTWSVPGTDIKDYEE